jgi:UDP-glucuronate 4-epimerase
MTILITGVAGFIGSHLASKMLSQNFNVIGIDNLNDYYSVNLKKYRLKQLNKFKNFTFIKADLSKALNLEKIIKKKKLSVICHLAAQAGVRYSITNPSIYLKYNIDGFLNILEYCRRYNTNLVYASSSSVYGANKKVPFSVNDDVSNPVSLYAVTKRSNELMAESYFNLYKLNSIGLRFFTVYGPMGRPDMAIWKFTESIINNKAIEVFNRGNLSRDFTYIDDIIDGVQKAIKLSKNKKFSKHRIYNLGNNSPVVLNTMIKLLEETIGKKAKKKLVSMQPGDVKKTFADIEKSKRELKFQPKTSLRQGLTKFVNWYKEYHKI